MQTNPNDMVFEPNTPYVANCKEKNLEAAIETWLTREGGYRKGDQAHYDHDRAIDMSELIAFIEATQPKEWNKYKKKYGDQSEAQLYADFQENVAAYGLIHVLRNGFKNLGIALRPAFFRPNSELNEELMEKYRANRLTVVRQFAVDKARHQIIDMVLMLNGIPVVALELKNQLTGQSVADSVRQWREDRSPKEPLFRSNQRVLAYFGVDLYEAQVATELKGTKTYFMPYNQGSNGAGNVGGAGNPAAAHGEFVTEYLWKTVLNREMLLRILQRYISRQTTEELVLEVVHGKEKETTKTSTKILWPRYHQLDVVEKLTHDTMIDGPGHNYLIQHSAGSGKSNSIAWLTYQLAALHDRDQRHIFDCVFVLTDRRILNKQLRETVLSFDHTLGQVATITDNDPSSKLEELIKENNTRIIICTIHRFPYIYTGVQGAKGRRYAIIVDEAHSSQSGKNADATRAALGDTDAALQEWADLEEKPAEELASNFDEIDEKLLAQGGHTNLSFYAFTATPKPKTLQVFGRLVEKGSTPAENKYAAYHNYSMQQAIEEGFIKDVLEQYTNFEVAYRMGKTCEENDEYEETPATKAVKAFHDNHQNFIEQLTKVIVEKFREVTLPRMGGEAKAMVVCPSRFHAMRIYMQIKEYCREMGYTDVNPLVAFSGSLSYFGKEYTEVQLNSTDKRKISEEKLPLYFGSKLYNVLVVADKYQTGFDEPKLHTMFLIKKVQNVKAVQTLSRLNRFCPGKEDTYVFDFVNGADEIRKAFEPFYKGTELIEATDPNNVYKFLNELRKYHLWSETDEQTLYDNIKNEKVKNRRLAIISNTLKPVIERYAALEHDEQDKVRSNMKAFLRFYTFMAQIVRTYDRALFMSFIFVDSLFKLLPKRVISPVELDDKLKLLNSRIDEGAMVKIVLGESEPQKGEKPKQPGSRDVKVDTLQNIIDKVNLMFQGNFSKEDEVIIGNIYDRLTQKLQKSLDRQIKNNEERQFEQAIFPDMFNEIAQECFREQANSYKKLFEDPEFYQNVMSAMANVLYNSFKNQQNPPFVLENFRKRFLAKVGSEFDVIKRHYQPLDEAVDLMVQIIKEKTDDSLDGANDLLIDTFNRLYCGKPSAEDKSRFFLTLCMKFETYLKKVHYLKSGELLLDREGGNRASLTDAMFNIKSLWGLKNNTAEGYQAFSQMLQFVKNLRNDQGHIAPKGTERELDMALHILSTMYLYVALTTRGDLMENAYYLK